jgi:hypothetical protein
VPSPRCRARIVLTALLVAGAPSLARAEAMSVFGHGPAGVAEVGARVARANDGSAAFYNPGGLALGTGYHAEAGTMGMLSGLSAAGKKRRIEDPFATQLALDADVPLEGPLEDRLRIGLAAHALPTRVLHLILRASETPQLPYYDNRTQRLAALPSLAVRLAPFLGIGFAIDTLAGLEGTVDLRAGASRTPEPRIDETAKTVMRPIVGVRLDPSSSVHVGLVFRGQFDLTLRTDSSASVGGVPLNVHAEKHHAMFDPATLTAGVAVDLSPRASVELDGSYLFWGRYLGPAFDVTASLPGVQAETPPSAKPFRDTFTVRGAGSFTVPVKRHDVIVRGGLGYERSMMTDERQGLTNWVDADKILAGAGATLVVRGALSGDLRVGLGVQAHVLPTRTFGKVACTAFPCAADTVSGPDATAPSSGITDPGYPKLKGGGVAGAAALSVGVDL